MANGLLNLIPTCGKINSDTEPRLEPGNRLLTADYIKRNDIKRTHHTLS